MADASAAQASSNQPEVDAETQVTEDLANMNVTSDVEMTDADTTTEDVDGPADTNMSGNENVDGASQDAAQGNTDVSTSRSNIYSY